MSGFTAMRNSSTDSEIVNFRDALTSWVQHITSS